MTLTPTPDIRTISTGRSAREVEEILGPPSRKEEKCTWKCGIPTYPREEARHTTYYYRDKGRIVFNGSGNRLQDGSAVVTEVQFDVTEAGQGGAP